MIAAFIQGIWEAAPQAGCIIDPVNRGNEASWLALLRAGFQLVGRGDPEPDNPIDDRSHEVLGIDRPSELARVHRSDHIFRSVPLRLNSHECDLIRPAV